MIIYTIKIANEKSFRYELIRFCEKYKLSVYITFMQEDIFTDVLFCDIVIPIELKERFESKYKMAITHSENL
jgi:hypothetical protein